MMQHAPAAFAADAFLEALPRVRNGELHYAAIGFALEEEPLLLGRLLTALTPKLDHARVVHLIRKLGASGTASDAGGATALLGLVLPYLRSVQGGNITAVNEAINGVLVEEEDSEGLRASIAAHDAFDQIGLAGRLEKNALLEMRRIAASLFKAARRWEASIALSKRDAQFADAIATAAESGDGGLAEGLLSFFLGRGDKESFAAALFACSRIVRPDVALELAWRHRVTDYAMPFMIATLRDSQARIAALEAKIKPAEEDASAAAAGGVEGVPGMDGGLNPYGYGAPVLALTDSPYNPSIGGYGAMPPPPLGGMAAYGVPGAGGMGQGLPGMGMGGMQQPGYY